MSIVKIYNDHCTFLRLIAGHMIFIREP